MGTPDRAPGPPSTPGPGGRRTWLGPACLVVVLAVALVIGSGVGRSHPTSAQRTEALEAQIKCPSCDDLSVLDSSASAAVAVRHEIARQVAEGRTDQQIDDALVAQYGPTILLSPPTHGLTALVWIVPAVAGAAALATVGALFWRRGRQLSVLRGRGS